MDWGNCLCQSVCLHVFECLVLSVRVNGPSKFSRHCEERLSEEFRGQEVDDREIARRLSHSFNLEFVCTYLVYALYSSVVYILLAAATPSFFPSVLY